LPILYNLGCKLNQYEGHALCTALTDDADAVIVNTCCVTNEAEIKSRRRLRHARRKYPGRRLIATGCACFLHPEDFTAADRIILLTERNRLIERSYPKPNRSRYFLKIQDGCSEPCTYCIVPRVRPVLESKSYSDIIKEITWAGDNGFREVVLVGANIGLYDRENHRSLTDLIRTLIPLAGPIRFRLSSIEPRFITPELIAALKDLKVCRHFHVPIQSADDAVLKAMGRPGGRFDLEQVVDRLSAAFADCAIGADLIVGFPAEDDAAFERTFEFIQAKPFTHLHVFPYSPRPGTAVQALGDPVPAASKKDRRLRLQTMVRAKNLAFRQAQIGKILDAVMEHDPQGKIYALSDNYLRVRVAGSHPGGARIRIRIDQVEPYGLSGTFVE
jgi:threonylcarbamoyladenosine tRNA methylthiotransferase MtaB